jgi:hypothetical protein
MTFHGALPPTGRNDDIIDVELEIRRVFRQVAKVKANAER